jgi:Cysteine-rich secretory protein family
MAFPDLPQTEVAIIEMTNVFRAENRLAPVKTNATLAQTAKAFADYLAKTGKFAHEADGRKPHDRTAAAGYTHCIVAENLALNQDSRGFETRGLARQAIDGWKASPPHRAAMLNPDVTEIGVGIAKAADAAPKYLSVQVFGRPGSLQVTFTIENRVGAPIAYRFDGKQHPVQANGGIQHTVCKSSQVVIDGVAAPLTPANGGVYRIQKNSAGKIEIETTPARR